MSLLLRTISTDPPLRAQVAWNSSVAAPASRHSPLMNKECLFSGVAIAIGAREMFLGTPTRHHPHQLSAASNGKHSSSPT